MVAFFVVMSGVPGSGPALAPRADSQDGWPLPTIEPLNPIPELSADPIAPYMLSIHHQMIQLSRPVPATCTGLARFTDEAQLAEWLPESRYTFYDDADSSGPVFIVVPMGPTMSSGTLTALRASTEGAASLTNNQVQGVDEADTTKTDGQMLYTRYGASVAVVKIYPVAESKVLERVAVQGTLVGLLIDPSHLVVISQQQGSVLVRVYDRTGTSLAIERNVTISGTYTGARAIGDHIFVLTNFGLSKASTDGVRLPMLTVDGRERQLKATDVAYLESSRNSTSLISLVKMNLSSPDDPVLTSIVGDAGSTLYVSESNLYLAGGGAFWSSRGEEKTSVLKIPLRSGPVDCAVRGEFEGYVLNQYSLDEFEGNLRIATTIGHVARNGGTARNAVTILSQDLEPLGLLDDLAPGERIYSARFMGDRLYLVTFKKVDPLFVIDLADPAAPSVLGYLKIPGFSSYLHPIGPGLILGVGTDTVEATTGNFAWFQGVKLALFDVSDYENPREAAKLVIGDRGSWTPVSSDPHAFTWIAERSMLVLPIHVFEVDRSAYKGEPPANARGREAWNGVYAIRVSAEAGFEVVHALPYSGNLDGMSCIGGTSVGVGQFSRSFAVDGHLFVVAEDLVEAISLDDGAEVVRLEINDPDKEVETCNTWWSWD